MSGLSKSKTVPTQGMAPPASFLYSHLKMHNINCVTPRTSVGVKNSRSSPVGDFTVSITWSVATNAVTFWLPYWGKEVTIKEKAMAI